MLIDDLNHTIDGWISALEFYTFNQLCMKPAPGSWSLGQVYMHVSSETTHFIAQARICLATNDHAADEMTPAAKKMFLDNTFPNALLEGPPSNARTPQPTSKEQLKHSLQTSKEELAKVEDMFFKSPYNGKTKHPGLGYFNAAEWVQFADMHLRHHLRQTARLEIFLRKKDV